jgi:hypothetical protein
LKHKTPNLPERQVHGMDGVERLTLVSKILFDTRLVEIKNENEALKLKLFWKEHNPAALKEAMSFANQVCGGTKCSCTACLVSGRYLRDDVEVLEISSKTCVFRPWFEQVLREHDMSVAYGLPDVPIWVDGTVVDDHNNVLDDGHHFSNLASQDWFCWTYGSKLWKATSVHDPELTKLVRLFRTLETLGDDV